MKQICDNRIKKKAGTHAQRGNSLLGIAFFLIMFGLITAGVAKTADKWVSAKRLERTNVSIEQLKKELALFVEVNGHLPCPARPDAQPTDADYGRSYTGWPLPANPDLSNAPGAPAPAPYGVAGDLSDDCALIPQAGEINGVVQRARNGGGGGGAIVGRDPDGAGPMSRNIWIGALPVRTLGLPDEMMLDGWKKRVRYAVTEDYTRGTKAAPAPAFKEDAGAISVKDGDRNEATDPDNPLAGGGSAIYVLLAYEQDDNGAYNESGQSVAPCGNAAGQAGTWWKKQGPPGSSGPPPTPTVDSNCNFDAEFLNSSNNLLKVNQPEEVLQFSQKIEYDASRAGKWRWVSGPWGVCGPDPAPSAAKIAAGYQANDMCDPNAATAGGSQSREYLCINPGGTRSYTSGPATDGNSCFNPGNFGQPVPGCPCGAPPGATSQDCKLGTCDWVVGEFPNCDCPALCSCGPQPACVESCETNKPKDAAGVTICGQTYPNSCGTGTCKTPDCCGCGRPPAGTPCGASYPNSCGSIGTAGNPANPLCTAPACTCSCGPAPACGGANYADSCGVARCPQPPCSCSCGAPPGCGGTYANSCGTAGACTAPPCTCSCGAPPGCGGTYPNSCGVAGACTEPSCPCVGSCGAPPPGTPCGGRYNDSCGSRSCTAPACPCPGPGAMRMIGSLCRFDPCISGPDQCNCGCPAPPPGCGGTYADNCGSVRCPQPACPPACTYVWSIDGGFGSCYMGGPNDNCGQQDRPVTCRCQQTGAVVGDGNCAGAGPKPEWQSCEANAYYWGSVWMGQECMSMFGVGCGSDSHRCRTGNWYYGGYDTYDGQTAACAGARDPTMGWRWSDWYASEMSYCSSCGYNMCGQWECPMSGGGSMYCMP